MWISLVDGNVFSKMMAILVARKQATINKLAEYMYLYFLLKKKNKLLNLFCIFFVLQKKIILNQYIDWAI